MGSANERECYILTLWLIGSAHSHTQNDACSSLGMPRLKYKMLDSQWRQDFWSVLLPLNGLVQDHDALQILVTSESLLSPPPPPPPPWCQQVGCYKVASAHLPLQSWLNQASVVFQETSLPGVREFPYLVPTPTSHSHSSPTNSFLADIFLLLLFINIIIIMGV